MFNITWMLSKHIFQNEHGGVGHVVDSETQKVLKLISHILRDSWQSNDDNTEALDRPLGNLCIYIGHILTEFIHDLLYVVFA